MALKVVALIKAQPGKEAEVGQALKELAAASKGDQGCLSYELYSSAQEPTTFVTVEEWGSKDDLDAHMQAPHLAKAMEVAGTLLTGPPEIHPLTPA